MSFAENLKLIRKERNITQEHLAEILDVTRQAVSKWESGCGYPETEKLLILSKELNVSLDYLLLDGTKKINQTNEKMNVIVPSGKISITTFDKSKMITCHAVKSLKIIFTGKNEPKYILIGIDKVTFWGEHTTILGWYEQLEEVEKEICEITTAIEKVETVYLLMYASDVEFVGIFGKARLKEQ
ncbi:MAG TPA: helix-turn-helix transcriptional regulator [Mobilitalea sp.]|nr:helix-turn-helix transcriptional regulator [Mobilitalea sp.]